MNIPAFSQKAKLLRFLRTSKIWECAESFQKAAQYLSICLIVEEDVHLLADVDGEIGAMEFKNDLKDAGVDPFRAFSGE